MNNILIGIIVILFGVINVLVGVFGAIASYNLNYIYYEEEDISKGTFLPFIITIGTSIIIVLSGILVLMI